MEKKAFVELFSYFGIYFLLNDIFYIMLYGDEKMTKILFCDMDGTLYNHGSVYSKKDFEAIRKFRAAGNIFAVCTGRNKMGVTHLGNDEPLEYDYMCLCNGALIMDNKEHTYFEKVIPGNIGNEIMLKYYDKDNVSVYCTDGERNIQYKEDILGEFGPTGPIDINGTFEEQINTCSKYFLIALDSIHRDFDLITSMQTEIAAKYGQYVEMFPNKSAAWCCVDIVPSDCSKGQSIQRLIDLAGLEVDGIYAIGDSYNDISMLDVADQGYTFNRADDVIKTHGKCVDFVYEAIEEIMSK